MIEVTIRQKDSNTHTKFLVLHGGRTFSDYNFKIAKDWYDQELLTGESANVMRAIIAARKANEIEDQNLCHCGGRTVNSRCTRCLKFQLAEGKEPPATSASGGQKVQIEI